MPRIPITNRVRWDISYRSCQKEIQFLNSIIQPDYPLGQLLMSIWERYPHNYRTIQVQAILSAVKAGECFSIVGLSGSGKSNLLGFIAHRQRELLVQHDIPVNQPAFFLIDCNQLVERRPAAFFQLVRNILRDPASTNDAIDELAALGATIAQKLEDVPGVSLLFDRFDVITSEFNEHDRSSIMGNLRALRDHYKYALTFVTATRRPLDQHSELAELFYAHTVWLGSLSESDALWSIQSYASRSGLVWMESEVREIIKLSGAYPALLRAVCEAKAAGAELDLVKLGNHPAVLHRVEEFWADQPDDELLQLSGLRANELLGFGRKPHHIDTSRLTAKESYLWEWFQSHPGEVCHKDDLIRAVWPEDRVYETGIRDDSLAQLVRRLREKVESDPSNPRYIQTIPGRGYRFIPG